MESSDNTPIDKEALPPEPQVVQTPIKLPIVEPGRGRRRVIIAALSLLVVAILAGIITLLMMTRNNAVKSDPTPTPTPSSSVAVAKKPCKIGVTADCPITKDEYVMVAKQVYLIKSGSLKDSDAATKQDIAKISDFLTKNHPGNDFILESSYDTSNGTEKATSYRAHELVNGAVVELTHLVPQLRVATSGVTLDLTDDTAKVTTATDRQAIVTTGALTQDKLITAIENKLAKLTPDQSSKLYVGDSNAITTHYSLVHTGDQGLIYRISLNASTLILDANTGRVLDEDWTSGLQS